MKYLTMILGDIIAGLKYLVKVVGGAILACAVTLSILFTVIVYGEQLLLAFVTFLGFPPFDISARGADDGYITNFGTGAFIGIVAYLGYQRYTYVKLPWYRVLAEMILGTVGVVAAVLFLLVLFVGLCGVTLPFVMEWAFNHKSFIEVWDSLSTGKQILGCLGAGLVATPFGALIGLYSIELRRRAGANE